MQPTAPVMGIDPHLDTFDLYVADGVGRRLAAAQYTNDTAGWEQAATTAAGFGVERVGIEGASGYGMALAQTLTRHQLTVLNVPTRVTSQLRARQGSGKNDQIDAQIVAHAVLAGRGNLWIDNSRLETLRMVTHRRAALVQDQTRDINQLRALMIELDPPTAARLGRLRSTVSFQRVLAQLPTSDDSTRVIHLELITQLCVNAMARLEQIRALEKHIKTLLPPAGHRLIATTKGCNLITAATLLAELAGTDGCATHAKFASWSGVAPLDASSGRQLNHRLNRGGNRQANRAIHTIVTTQLRHGGQAADYIDRRQQEGLTRRHAIRACKRHVARRVWKILRDAT